MRAYAHGTPVPSARALAPVAPSRRAPAGVHGAAITRPASDHTPPSSTPRPSPRGHARRSRALRLASRAPERRSGEPPASRRHCSATPATQSPPSNRDCPIPSGRPRLDLGYRSTMGSTGHVISRRVCHVTATCMPRNRHASVDQSAWSTSRSALAVLQKSPWLFWYLQISPSQFKSIYIPVLFSAD